MTTNLIELDKMHRSLALDASKSFIVQAPAGSGKTELLIQRFLTLLTLVNSPEEILAITFTKKAANEMRLRVITALKQALYDSEATSDHAKKTWLLAKRVLQRDKQYNWHLIDNPNQLRIQTIDSLCAYLTKQLPLLSHFGSPPNMAENPTSLYREAAQEVFMLLEENNEWSQAISCLLLHLDNDLNKLHDLLIHLLAKRDQWLPYIRLNTNAIAIKQQLEHYLGLIISESLQTLVDIFPKDIVSPLLSIARFAADHLASQHVESDLLACRDLTELPGVTPSDKRAWLGLANLLLTKNFTWRKRVDADIGFPPSKSLKNPHEIMQVNEYKRELMQIINTLVEHEELRIALSELSYLPEQHYLDKQWETLQALLQVLKITAAQLRVIFQQYGQIDFIENTQAALIALGNEEHPTDLALALDYQIQHILVDEFQDTSFTQYQLIEKLTSEWEAQDGRTLFIVGDPMQSIYRFREAEVGLFIRMYKMGIGHIKLHPLTLAINFRSTPTIVEWNNAHFHAIFPSFNDIATGAVSYSPSISNQQTAIPIDGSLRARAAFGRSNDDIVIQGFIQTEDNKQANEIVGLIIKTKKNHPDDNIAILVRSRSHLNTIIPLLKKAKLSYFAVDIDPLASRQSIQDLLSLTCALLHPADRIAWLSILRAPWCGLTLADLLVIAGGNPYAPLWEQLQKEEIRKAMSADGQQRVAKLMSILTSKLAERERYSLRYWIESTWLLLGGPACLNDVSEMDDVTVFFKLLHEFSNTHQIINLDKLKERIDQLYASTQHEDKTLQIMTIHTAKGLEFDTVILPQLDKKCPNDDKALMQWMERPLMNDQTALLLAPIHATGNEKDALYEYIHRQQRIKSDYETDRLLYVATTRAKKRLYLFFTVHENNNHHYKIESSSFLDKLWPFFEKKKNEIMADHTQHAHIENPQIEKQRQLARLTSTWNNPIREMMPIKITSHQKQSGFRMPDNVPKVIGVVTHSVLQHIAQMDMAWWLTKSIQEQSDYLQHQFIQLGLCQEALHSSINTTLQSIQRTLNDSRGRWILHAHHEAQSEFAMTAMINGVTENLVMDRTFVDETNTRWIIDYKTSMPSYQDVALFLSSEQEKYAEQMHKYFQAMTLIDDRPIRLGLYFPALPAWREWTLD